MPAWFDAVATVSLVLSVACAVLVAADIIAGHRQRMPVMNVVWPVAMLWAGPVGLYAYLRSGRVGAARDETPFAFKVAEATMHCGAGCTLGDLVAESFAIGVPFALFGHRLFGSWVYDYVAAFALGIAFQYFTIRPMRDISRSQGLLQAIKIDAASLTAWQVGMYGATAIAVLAICHHELPKSSPAFWAVMQLAMWAGFLTSYPVNWWLVRTGVKEVM